MPRLVVDLSIASLKTLKIDFKKGPRKQLMLRSKVTNLGVKLSHLRITTIHESRELFDLFLMFFLFPDEIFEIL